ncbi:hypothetical protein GQ57_19090 [Burkholderia sp. MSh2]|nr:hypothetical protein GQ57_19090 [Burkholderia sp. MSh2]
MMIDSQDDRVALPQGNDFRPPGFLRITVDKHKFATREVAPRLVQEKDDLKREYVFPVKILVKTAIVVLVVSQQERRRTILTRTTTDIAKLGMRRGKSFADSHLLMPAIRNRSKVRIEQRAQRPDKIRQRLREVFVFPPPERITRHHDMAPEAFVLWKKHGQLVALSRFQHPG